MTGLVNAQLPFEMKCIQNLRILHTGRVSSFFISELPNDCCGEVAVEPDETYSMRQCE